MKKLLITLLKFLGFFLLLYIIYVLVGGTIAPKFFGIYYDRGGDGYLFTHLNEAKQIKKTGILFLGNSHAYRSFDTRIFEKDGIKSFNLGSSAQTPLQTEIIMKRYLNSIHPKLIIYEVSPDIFSSDGVEPTIDLLSNDYLDASSIKLALQLNNPKIYSCLIYSFYKSLTDKDYSEPLKNGTDTYIPGGFVQKELHYYVPSEKDKFERKEIEINPMQLKAFNNIIQLFKNNDYPYILVTTPVTKDWYSRYKNIQQFHKRMASYGQYHDFNHQLEMVDTLHFYDFRHLNQLGASRYDSFLIEKLQLKNRVNQKEDFENLIRK